MGFYIETNTLKHKADWLIANARAREMNRPFKGDKDNIPVVIVDNGPFEAAAICFDQSELDAFTEVGDYRPKRFLLVPRTKVIELNPKVESRLNWR